MLQLFAAPLFEEKGVFFLKYLLQLCIILLISFIGEVLNSVIPLPIPASIYGMVIMLTCLIFKVIKLEWVKDTGKFLVDVMPVMFIPAAVGIINSWSVIQPKLLAYGVITFASTFIVMAVSGRVTQKIIRGGKKHD